MCAESEVRNPNSESQNSRQVAMEMMVCHDMVCHDAQDTGGELSGDAHEGAVGALHSDAVLRGNEVSTVEEGQDTTVEDEDTTIEAEEEEEEEEEEE